ncbi:proto-oncogene Mas-like isoform X3 [Hemicordylus capensis]|nr:proto-oncogene Mas-like isoform X3 [Hemicordylus capensis]XP_053150702.1 proto-oncogene Mas-like isoform X3 [Hemicordylus capensis]XP_053150713.1 proto-oncogene Mas-like isoform X3 [Hemicordylus capensis]XP_053150722.1 proto-oncogene Mas-like isoform X3 [Hemicordylus capensis]XP_053150732.1 proto-oncogene Mas-like isoform X3 [Hemicordylus capensis]XP_053150735.1 proto-oncogene Mas-like isoform X3 [Hemicordylus capensis]XP_053150745.1 proto-oncogene Mas-like isoform X3 [Hemicordylus capensi
MATDASTISSHAAGAANATGRSWGTPHQHQKTVIISAIPICVVGLIVNGIVISLLCCKIKTTKYIVYVLNMAIADFTVLFYQFMFFILFFKPLYTSAHFARIFDMIYALGHNSSFYILTGLCAERFLFTFFPVWYQSHRPNHQTVIVCVTMWAFSLLMSLLEYFACYQKSGIIFNCWSTTISEIVFEFLVFVPILFCSVLALFVRSQKQAPETPSATLDITIIGTGLLALILDVSVRTLHLIEFSTTKKLPLFLITVLFDCTSSSVSPFVFLFVGLWKSEKGRKPLYAILERALTEEAEEADSTQAGQEQA